MKILNRFLSKRPGLASIAVAILLALGLAAQARAEVIFGLDTQDDLVSYDSATPGTVRSFAKITGLQFQEEVRGIAFGPSGALFGFTSAPDNSSRLYTIDPLTGAATIVGAGPFSPPAIGGTFGFSVDPITGQARLVSSIGQNLRINTVTGTAVPEAMLAYAPGDPNFGRDPSYVKIAYSTSLPGAPPTTLYGIDSRGQLFRMGSFGGSPISADSGQLFTIAQVSSVLGIGANGFAISPATGIAYENTFGSLYRVDLATGAGTLIGALHSPIFPVDQIAVQPVPEPGSGFILAIGLPFLLGLTMRAKMTNSERKDN
jgi:hypothetical protein